MTANRIFQAVVAVAAFLLVIGYGFATDTPWRHIVAIEAVVMPLVWATISYAFALDVEVDG